MGLLSLGTPLHWDEARQHVDHVRSHGISQFLNIWDRVKDRQGDELLWGDEVEYIVVSLDHENKTASLSLRQSEILRVLADATATHQVIENEPNLTCMPTFHPEYGRYMLESTPGAPYTGSLSDLLSVENSMRFRRALARKNLKETEVPISFTSYPRLGTPGKFTEPYYDPAKAKSSHSLFLPEEITNPHARFPTLTANIRRRRGSKVAINLPIFFDKNTPRPFIDPTIPWDRNIYKEDSEAKNGAALPDHIYMDAMGFGMGCSCLQLTFQACSVDEARRLYDGLIPLGPIMLALSAASPAWRGYLADVDCRWNVIAGSVDDRTEEERGLKPLKNNKFKIPKSRYDSVDLYISPDWRNRPEYNDVDAPYDPKIYCRLRDHGLDDLLSKHIAHLFIRDPIVVFSELLHQDDTTSADHFENIQSTNWQTIRFKPPPPNSHIGWRVEFRSMEVQITDFENAAFSVFVVLLSRAILNFGLNFYLPISKVDENMGRAQQRDAARSSKFYFRSDIYPPGQSRPSSVSSGCCDEPAKDPVLRNCFALPAAPKEGFVHPPVEDEYQEMTMDEIINTGKGDTFPGLMTLVVAYLDSLNVKQAVRQDIDRYLDLIHKRASGELQTTASWIRDFVRDHEDYKFDSVVSDRINYDLMNAVDEIERGVRREDSLLPSDYPQNRTSTGVSTQPILTNGVA